MAALPKNMDLCELSPSYVRSIAPYQPGKPISELAREMGLDEKTTAASGRAHALQSMPPWPTSRAIPTAMVTS